MDSFDPSTSGGESAAHDVIADDHSAAMESRHHSSTGSSSTDGDLEQAMSHTRPKPTKGKRKAAKRQQAKKHGTKKKGRPRKPAPPAEVSPPPHSATHALHANDGHAATIDEVIDESDALLRAAYEAQSLGRLAAAQSYLYLAHARLIGLGRWLERPHAAEADDGNAHCGGAAHENLSDQLARSAQRLLQKHGGRGMRCGKRKGTASYAKKKKRNDTVVEGSDGQDEPAAPAPARSVRTVVHGDRLDAKSMVNEGIQESADEEESVRLGTEDEGNTTMESEVEEEPAVEELEEAMPDLPDRSC